MRHLTSPRLALTRPDAPPPHGPTLRVATRGDLGRARRNAGPKRNFQDRSRPHGETRRGYAMAAAVDVRAITRRARGRTEVGAIGGRRAAVPAPPTFA